MQGARVRSLVGELRSLMLCDVAKNFFKINLKKTKAELGKPWKGSRAGPAIASAWPPSAWVPLCFIFSRSSSISFDLCSAPATRSPTPSHLWSTTASPAFLKHPPKCLLSASRKPAWLICFRAALGPVVGGPGREEPEQVSDGAGPGFHTWLHPLVSSLKSPPGLGPTPARMSWLPRLGIRD